MLWEEVQVGGVHTLFLKSVCDPYFNQRCGADVAERKTDGPVLLDFYPRHGKLARMLKW